MKTAESIALPIPARSPAVVAHALVRQLRPKQWVKNLTCLAGVIFSGRLVETESVAQAGLGFLTFSLGASAVYIFNDLLDLEKDRRNPRTARRPLASGDLPVGVAAVALGLLLVAALAGSWWLAPGCAVVFALYAGMNVLYTLWLKKLVLTDVMCIALGFVLRVVYGVYLVHEKPTAWIALCMFFLALFLGFAKRKAELGALGDDSADVRPVLKEYGEEFLNLLLGITATLTVLAYALFAVASHKNPTLIITVVPVVYCVSRYLFLVLNRGHGQSPEDVFLTDVGLWIGVLCWLALGVGILYGQLDVFAETSAWHKG